MKNNNKFITSSDGNHSNDNDVNLIFTNGSSDNVSPDYGLTDISNFVFGEDNKEPEKKKSKKKTAIIISSIAAAVIVALGITGFCLHQNGILFADNSGKGFRFSEGTTVSGISIAGKTVEEAKELLEASTASIVSPFTLEIDINGKSSYLNENDFEYTYDIDSVLSTIVRDETQAASEKKSVFGKSDSKEKTYEVAVTVNPESIRANAKKLEDETNLKPKNAYINKFHPYAENRFEYVESTEGKKLNTDRLIEKMSVALETKNYSDKIVAEVEAVKPERDIENLKKNIVKLSTYETVSYNTENGTSNMRVALEACNGSIINPYNTWSFNECTGDSNLESNGYKPAHVISNGKLIDGIGGGICQASSTIYNAAIRANMKIEERYNHKWASAYVPTGLDATIDYPRLDLKLSNPTDYQMFLECKMIDTTLTVTIWGYKSPDYDVITTHNLMGAKSSNAYSVKAWRIYYKDGKEIDRESLGTSTYDADQGYIFYSADNDSGAKDVDYEPLEKPTDPTTPRKQSSSSKSSSSKKQPSSSSSQDKPSSSSSKAPSSSSRPSSSSQSSKPTEKPTQPPHSSSESESSSVSSSSEAE